MRRKRFIPDVLIFNAGILENDYLTDGRIDINITKRIMETNYIAVLLGFSELIKFTKKRAKIVFIGSSLAFSGRGESGVGYASSKAALNSAFESLHQRLGNKYDFKIVHFGPVKTDMVPFNHKVMFMQTPEQAARAIIKAIYSEGHIFYFPWMLFLILHLIKILPSPLYLSVLDLLNALHKRNRK